MCTLVHLFIYNCNIVKVKLDLYTYKVNIKLDYLPFIRIICRSSQLFKILYLFDKVICFYTIFDLSKTNQYEQTKNTTTKSKRALPSRKHQTYLRIFNCVRGIYYYRNPSKHLIMKTFDILLILSIFLSSLALILSIRRLFKNK